MSRVVIILLFFWINYTVECEKIDFKVITTVRHGLDSCLDYIDQHLQEVTVDCVMGVALARDLLIESYKNGTHIMDNSSMKLLSKAFNIIGKSRMLFQDDPFNGNDWKFQYLVDEMLWNHHIEYKTGNLWIDHRFLDSIIEMPKFPSDQILNSDQCLQEIVNSTAPTEYITPCIISWRCWKNYFENSFGHSYYLTHKLLLLQIAKARGCWLNEDFYKFQVRTICSSINFQIHIADSLKFLDENFDLFLEQVILCGREGFTELIRPDWLFSVLKSQRLNGCFPDNLTDPRKSRLKKRDYQYFQDGCNDHTTGIGAAVLALYYHYIVNEESISLV